jgi:hypothetical protein
VAAVAEALSTWWVIAMGERAQQAAPGPASHALPVVDQAAVTAALDFDPEDDFKDVPLYQQPGWHVAAGGVMWRMDDQGNEWSLEYRRAGETDDQSYAGLYLDGPGCDGEWIGTSSESEAKALVDARIAARAAQNGGAA